MDHKVNGAGSLARLRLFIGGSMSTKHNQDLPEVRRAAEEQRREDRRRSDQEREHEVKHDAQVDESRRARFVSRDECG